MLRLIRPIRGKREVLPPWSYPSIRGELPIGVCLTLWYYLSFFGKKEGFTDIAISFCVFPLILYAEKIAQLRAGNLARLAHR